MTNKKFTKITKSLSEIIQETTFNGIICKESVEEHFISNIMFETSLNDVQQRLKVKLKTGLCSSVILYQLARHHMNICERFGNEIHQYHLPTILDAIECVENGIETNIRKFNKQPLAGFKHIHHNSSTFIAQNMINTWKEMAKGKDEIEFQNELLAQIYLELLQSTDTESASNVTLPTLLGRVLDKSRHKTQTKQTGEWIIFAQKEQVNYYLCLATHKEAEDFTDQVIYDRLNPCLTEFPELIND